MTVSIVRSLFRKSLTAVVLVGVMGSMSATGASANPHFFPHPHGWGPGWGHGGHGWGPAAGLGLGLGVIGAVAAYDAYGERRVCRLVRQYDDYGNYLGRAQVCGAEAF